MMMTDVSSRIGALEWNDKTAIHSDNALETASGYVSTGPTTQVGCAITAPGHCRSIDDGTLEAASTSTAPTTRGLLPRAGVPSHG